MRKKDLLVLAGAALIVAGGSLVGLASAAGSSSVSQPDSSVVAPVRGEVADPYLVLDAKGTPVGHLDPVEFQHAEGAADDPVVPVPGAAHVVRGFEVHNDAGELVGYSLVSLGYHSLEEINTPGLIDGIIAEHEALRAAAVEKFGPSFKDFADNAAG